MKEHVPAVRAALARELGALGASMGKPAFLYYLADPRTPRRPRYLGITTNVEARAKRHRSMASTNHMLYEWKKAMRREGIDAVLVVVQEFEDIGAARYVEWRLINRWQRRGLCDLNAEAGRSQAWALMCAGKYHGRRTA